MNSWHKIYLCGAVTDTPCFQATVWRDRAKEFLDPATCIDPMRGVQEALSRYEISENQVLNDHLLNKMCDQGEAVFQPSFFVPRDAKDIRDSSAMLVNLEMLPRSAGTYIEIGIASEAERRDPRDGRGIPIFAFTGEESNAFTRSQFLQQCLTCTSPSLEKACQAIREYFS